MKRFWHTWLALVATAAMVSTANAQEIGSYQSILARAGYAQGGAQAQMSVPSPPGAGCNTGCGTSGSGYGGAYGNGAYGGGYGGGNAYGGSYGGAAYGGNFGGGNAYGGSSYGGMYGGGNTAYGSGGAMSGGQMNGGMNGQMNMAGGQMAGGGANGGMVGGQMNGGVVNGGMIGGGVVNGGMTNGGMVGGGVANGGMINGGMVGGGVANGGMINGGMVGGGVANGGMINGGMVGGGVVNGGMINGGMVGGGVINGGMMNGGAVYGGDMGGQVIGSAPSYGTSYVDYGVNNYVAAPVYVAGNAGVQSRLARTGGGGNNMVLGIFGVVLRRDYEDRVQLARDGGGNHIFSKGVEHGRMSGIGLSLASRSCNGGGWETSYWGLDEEDDRTYFGPITSDLNGLTSVTLGAFDVYTLFNGADNVRIYRDTDIHNFEFNLLRNGGQYQTRFGKSANFELTGGLRLFKFDESFRYVSNTDVATYPTYPTTVEYSLEAENTLVGFQVGGRSEVCLSNRMRMSYGGQVGLFNNNIETRQRIFDETGAVAQVNGRDFDYTDTKNDAAMLGQFDAGLIYQLSQSARLRVGYRALGVAGVALAVDQIPHDFTITSRNNTSQSNGNLLLHGLYFGSEFCF